MRQIRASKQYLDDPEVTDYINGLGYQLVANSPNTGQSFEFFVIDDPSINAFALPGGFIGVHTGLIVTSESESELAAVLAHEIGARDAAPYRASVPAAEAGRHGVAGGDGAGYPGGALEPGSGRPRRWPAPSTRPVQTQLNFTRDNEREADRVGVQILEKSGFDPHAMPVFLDRHAARVSHLRDQRAVLCPHPPAHLRADRGRAESSRCAALPAGAGQPRLPLVRARLQVEQYPPRDAVAHFEDILREKKTVSEPPARYGLVLALLRLKDFPRANREVDVLRAEAPDNAMVAALAGRVKMAAGDLPGALQAVRGRRASASRAIAP